jgi:hypothetical protein
MLRGKSESKFAISGNPIALCLAKSISDFGFGGGFSFSASCTGATELLFR